VIIVAVKVSVFAVVIERDDAGSEVDKLTVLPTPSVIVNTLFKIIDVVAITVDAVIVEIVIGALITNDPALIVNVFAVVIESDVVGAVVIVIVLFLPCAIVNALFNIIDVVTVNVEADTGAFEVVPGTADVSALVTDVGCGCVVVVAVVPL